MIYTFYSYKGGVGRSMALANVAELFFKAGLKVLLVDWDLEAPGIERFFPRAEEIVNKPGLIDMLVRYKQQAAKKPPEGKISLRALFETPEQYLIDVYPPASNGGRLQLLSAGRRGAPHFEAYARSVRTFDWQDFYENWAGEKYFEWLRSELGRLADVVLIDSRTGVTEMGGICTYQLADKIVMFCAANQQNLEGIVDMATNFSAEAVQQLRPHRPLELIIVPARIEDRAETTLLDEFHRQFIARLRPFTPTHLPTGSETFWELKIPYVPYYAFTERVAVREEDRASASDLIQAFVRILWLITHDRNDYAEPNKQLRQAVDRMLIATQQVGSLPSGWIVEVESSLPIVTGIDLKMTELRAAYTKFCQDHYGRINPQDLLPAEYRTRFNTSLSILDIYVPPMASLTEYQQGRPLTGSLQPSRHIRVKMSNSRETEQEIRSPEQHTEDVPLTAVAEGSIVLIFGDAGSGKSMFLKHLTLSLLTNPNAHTPLLLPLAAYSQALQKEATLSIKDYANQFYAQYGIDHLDILFDTERSNNRLVYLLDGLDEVPEDLQNQVGDKILALAHTLENNRLIVTSRKVGYTRLPLKTYLEAIIHLFNKQQINAFVHKWYRAQAMAWGVPESRLEATASRFIELLDTNSDISNLAPNPLLLTLLATNFSSNIALPKNRVRLYGVITRNLIEDWRKSRNLVGIPIGDRQSESQVINLLAPLAYWLQDQKPSGTATYNEIITQLARIERTTHPDEDPLPRVRHFLDEICIGSGIFAEMSFNEWGFVHLTFQEYFAAREMVRRPNRLKKEISQRAGNIRWAEVIRLTLAYLATEVGATEDVATLVMSMLDDYKSSQPHADPHVLFLAALAILDVQGIDQEVSESVVRELCNILLQSSNEHREEAAGILLQLIDSDLKDRILDWLIESLAIEKDLITYHKANTSLRNLNNLINLISKK